MTLQDLKEIATAKLRDTTKNTPEPLTVSNRPNTKSNVPKNAREPPRVTPNTKSNVPENAREPPRVTPTQQRSARRGHPWAVGTIIRKKFNSGWYEGEVVSYDQTNQFYRVRYTDGDIADYTHGEVSRYYKSDQYYSKSKLKPKALMGEIAIRFGTFPTKGNTHKHEALNDSFCHDLDDTAGLFITDDDADTKGPKTLAPDPFTMLKEIIVNTIMDIIPPKEQTEINKGHISTLFADACLWYVAPDKTTKTIRNKHSMDKAGALAIAQGQETLLIEIRATHWGFKSNWDAVHFDEVYDTKIYSFPEADDNDEDATAPTPVPAAAGTDMQQLTTLLQQLVNNVNNNNNTNNNNAGVNHQATLDLPWNPATLPPPVKERYYRKDKFLIRDDMKDFPITYTNSSGNETIVRQNYYLHNLGSGRNDKRLITRSGDCFDLTRASDESKEAARDKLFLSGFPQLKDATHPQVRKWYREITAHAQQQHIYIHPYYLYRREADHLRGFTIGDSLPHDLPARYELAIHEWGNLIYTALRTDKIIPDSCDRMKSTIQSFEGGQGYKALYTVIAQTHPNSKRPSNAGRMVRNPLNQDAGESLEEYYFRYKDYLRLRVFLQNQPSTISSTEEVRNLIAGTTLSEEILKKTEDERDSDDQFKRDKYKAEAYDWSNVYGIAFKFQSDNNPQEVLSLNGSYAETVPLTAPEISTLFTSDANDEGPRTLGPAPVTALREAFCNNITLEMANIDELAKGHIAQLLDSCPEFDSAGREAVRRAEATNDPEPLATTNNPVNYFNGIYTGEVQPDVDDDNEASNDENATAPIPAPTAAGTRMQQLTTLLQQLVNNGNNTNNTNNNAGANHQATLDLPWNPATLHPSVKERYYRKEEFLTRDDMKDFPITYTDSSGNETIVRQNYYLHNLGSGRNDQRLITRSGDCFDLTRASDKSKEAARDKLFLSGFPQLKDATHPQVRKWYREITAHAQQHHIYVHPYYLYRREADHLRGFTIGDSLPHDLPSRYELAINEWGNLIYTALRTDKIIPDSCASMKATIQSFEGGQGYEALYTVIAQTHPNSKRPSNAGRMVRDPPNQYAGESLEEYYFRYKDYLRLRVFLQNQSGAISLTEEVSNLNVGTTLSEELLKKTEDERGSDDQFKRDKYKAGRLLQTLQTYEQEIKAEKKYKEKNSKPSLSKQLPAIGIRPGPRRNDRFQKHAGNNTVRTPSTLTSHSISLIDSLGYPELDEESDNPFLHQAYCNAITAFDKQPSLFDTSRKCIVCHMSGHNFDNCPALQDVESLKKHRIATAVFLSKCNRETQQLLDSTQQISQINIGNEDQD
eukprot:jgi/Psemu1/44055/gm1.44055_g